MWLFFTLATTLLWGLAELFYKKGSHEERKYDHLRVCVLVGAVMGIHAIFTLLTSDISYDPRNLIAYLPVSLCYILSMACSFFGIRFIEESLADPIENTAGAMCSLLCVIFLGEHIPPIVWVAIAIILVGILGVTHTENSSEVNRKQKLGKKLAIVAFCMPFCYAMSGNGAIAAPILSSVCVVSLVLSRIFLKEKLTKKQYLFIGIIIVGILMLAVLEGE